MDDALQKKIHSVLLTVNGISQDKLFYQKASGTIDSKSFPRVIYSLVYQTPDYDTEDEFAELLIQISSFGHFRNPNVTNLKLIAAEIKYKLNLANLSGISGIKVSRCKLANYRESEAEDIFQIDQDFKVNISRV